MDLKCHAPILIAEDDDDDQKIIKDALLEIGFPNELHFFFDGEELIHFLQLNCNNASESYTRPGLILLDLNMPKKDGREVLKEIKADPHLCQIPIVVLTTTDSQEDVAYAYTVGANSFVTKPIFFSDVVWLMKHLIHYWFKVVNQHSKWTE